MRVAKIFLHFSSIAVAVVMLSAPMAATAFADVGLHNMQLQLAQTQLRTGDQNTQNCLSGCDQQTATCYRNAQGRAKEDCENAGTQCKNNCR
jgi:hypothetical protein